MILVSPPCEMGRGVEWNLPDAAAEWFRKASDAGDVDAKSWLKQRSGN